jgi:hypothetical protein
MSRLAIGLNEQNSRKIETLSRLTGKTPQELVNEILDKWLMEQEVIEGPKEA